MSTVMILLEHEYVMAKLINISASTEERMTHRGEEGGFTTGELSE